MQSYYVDEWQDEGILLEATFTPLSFGAHWLPGVGEALADRVDDYGRIASIGVHLHDSSEGRVRGLADGMVGLSYRLSDEEARAIQFGIARAADIHFAAGATDLPERRSDPGDPPGPGGRVRVREAAPGRPAA